MAVSASWAEASRPGAVVGAAGHSGVRSALGRAAVNAGTKRFQSAATTSRVTVSVSSSAPSADSAVSGASGVTAPCPRRRSPAAAAMPAPAQGPQAMDVAGRPSARRRSASASSTALAAAYTPCPALPTVPAREENRTKAERSRSRVSSSSSSAASALGPITRRTWSESLVRSVPSSSTPAAWNTASTGCSARSAARSSRTETSRAAIVTRAPDSSSSVRSSAAPGPVRPGGRRGAGGGRPAGRPSVPRERPGRPCRR